MDRLNRRPADTLHDLACDRCGRYLGWEECVGEHAGRPRRAPTLVVDLRLTVPGATQVVPVLPDSAPGAFVGDALRLTWRCPDCLGPDVEPLSAYRARVGWRGSSA
jgi:hypothetical protein